MKNRFRIVTAVVTALVLVSSVASQAARSHPLYEDAALALLVRTLKYQRVYEKRISLDCITYDTEETTDAYFQFALREKHDPKCGGDPETSPVVGPLSRLSPRRENQMVGIDRRQVATLRPSENQVD